jgi:hypothetical protein
LVPGVPPPPPPADVIVLKIELLPGFTDPEHSGEPAPPPPTVTGNVVAVIVKPAGATKGDAV